MEKKIQHAEISSSSDKDKVVPKRVERRPVGRIQVTEISSNDDVETERERIKRLFRENERERHESSTEQINRIIQMFKNKQENQ